MTTRASGSAVLGFIENGFTLDEIEVNSGWAKGEIVRLAREEGFALNVSSNRFQRAPKAKPQPQGIVRPAPQTDTGAESATRDHGTAATADAPAPVSPIRPAHRDVIDEGKAHSSLRVQRMAIKAEQHLTALAGMLAADRAAEAQRQAEAIAKAKHAARIAELERMLADEKAALRGKVLDIKPEPKTKRPPVGVDYQALDAWCQETGRPWRKQGMGRPTNALIAEFTAATADGAA